MSIISDALKGKISWITAAHDIVQWGEKLIAGNPAASAFVANAVSAGKQFASDAISIADSEFAQYLHPITDATEVALETGLAAITKGATVPFNAAISNAIDRLAASSQASAHLWALETKAKLAAPTPALGVFTGNSAMAVEARDADGAGH